jgi:hypothetical protein
VKNEGEVGSSIPHMLVTVTKDRKRNSPSAKGSQDSLDYIVCTGAFERVKTFI